MSEQLNQPIEDDPIALKMGSRPTFIPLRHYDLKSLLIETFQLTGTQKEVFLQRCAQLQSIFHIEHQATLLKLEELYERLDPDTQLVDVDPIDESRRKELGDWLIDHVSNLLFSAHYKRLTRSDLERAIEVGCQWGVRLDVDFELFDRLEIFARGYRTVTITRRRWQRLFWQESIELPEFTRLIIAFRVKPDRDDNSKQRKKVYQLLDSRFVYLKTFKNIPETDLEILLPGSRVRLTKFDRAKILFPTLSGMALTGYKLARSALILGLAFSWKTWFGFAVLIGGGIGYVVKAVLSYFRTKNNYQFGLTKSLYLKNLDNNLSVLYRILNEAEEQEISEAILAFTFLWKSDLVPESGITAEELDKLIESCLQDNTGLSVDFEIHDALGKLARLGLAHVDNAGRWTCVAIEKTNEAMQHNWSQLYALASRGREPGTIQPKRDSK